MIDNIKLFVKSNYLLFKLSRLPWIAAGYFSGRQHTKPDEYWSRRIESVVRAPDNNFLDRVPDAGRIFGDTQVMRNGIRIHVGSYYGDGNTVLLYLNKGVHEPQEERAFEEVLNYMPPGAAMLELGAFWAFYSMTFQKHVKDAVNYLIEPDPHALISGRNNFRLNKMKGDFFNYAVSDEVVAEPPSITVDAFLSAKRITRLNILHSDIQGYELKMLKGASNSLTDRKIDFIFVSTHSPELHAQCKEALIGHQYLILCDANLEEAFAGDGLIVARRKEMPGPDSLTIVKKI